MKNVVCTFQENAEGIPVLIVKYQICVEGRPVEDASEIFEVKFLRDIDAIVTVRKQNVVDMGQEVSVITALDYLRKLSLDSSASKDDLYMNDVIYYIVDSTISHVLHQIASMSCVNGIIPKIGDDAVSEFRKWVLSEY